jgi:hypothetical protein
MTRAFAAAITLSLAIATTVAADPELDRMMQQMDARKPAAAAPNDPAACREAKIGIHWVLALDEGARQTFDGAMRGGKSALEAVFWAQHHNPHAQDMIRRCAASERLVLIELKSGIRPGHAPAGAQPGRPAPGSPGDVRGPVGGVRVYQVNSMYGVEEHAFNSNDFAVQVVVTPKSCTPNVTFCDVKGGFVSPHSDSMIGNWECEDQNGDWTAGDRCKIDDSNPPQLTRA